jgi:hypothetical protein
LPIFLRQGGRLRPYTTDKYGPPQLLETRWAEGDAVTGAGAVARPGELGAPSVLHVTVYL